MLDDQLKEYKDRVDSLNIMKDKYDVKGEDMQQQVAYNNTKKSDAKLEI